jgi:hypothetical protein
MGLRRSHVKKGTPTVHGSRLFGIIDKVRHVNHVKSGVAGPRYFLDHESEKTVKGAMIEAESRKAQSITSTRQIGMHT